MTMTAVPQGTFTPVADIPTSDLFKLSNRTTIVTGGARGLGLAIAVALLEDGSDVICFDILDPEVDAWEVAQGTAKRGGVVLSHAHLDVTDADAVEKAIPAAFAAARPSHPVRGVFHAPGVQCIKPATDVSPAEFRRTLDINLTGSFIVAAAFARAYAATYPDSTGPGASIVFTASMSGRCVNRGLDCAVYNSSKAGVAQLARNLAVEWGKKGIRVNSLSPGYIYTALTAGVLEANPEFQRLWPDGNPMGRISVPAEFRGPVIFLLSDASSFMTGADLVVDGGHTIW